MKRYDEEKLSSGELCTLMRLKLECVPDKEVARVLFCSERTVRQLWGNKEVRDFAREIYGSLAMANLKKRGIGEYEWAVW